MIKIKYIKRAILTLEDGTQLEVERIGKGRYSEVFKVIGSNKVYTKTSDKDNGKEILRNLSPLDHIPNVKSAGYFQNENYLAYKMPLYSKLTAKSGDAWKQFKKLEQFFNDSCEAARRKIGFGRENSHEWALEINKYFNDFVQCSDLPNSLRESIALLIDECGNYGAYQIEIAKRNCAVDSDGKLILLDPCFDREELEQSRREQMEKRRGY